MNTGIPGRQDVIDMALDGVRPAEIEARTGLSINTIYHDLYQARKQGQDIPNFTAGRQRAPRNKVRVTLTVSKDLEAQALSRDLTVKQLAECLLSRIVEDDLVVAVLDDGGRHG